MTGLPGEPGLAGRTGPTGQGGAAPLRRLVVLRHAKSAWPEDVPDRDRPLAARGERDAPAAGRAIAGTVGPPGLALCSTAVRARRTWELAAAEWDTSPPVRYEPRLYAAGAPGLLAVVREAPADVGTLLLIGHNPGLADLVLALAGDGADDTLDRVRVKFPTSAVAVLSWRGAAWPDLAPGTALLTAMTVPRGPAR
ncbi:histidine phosphatase family protein [Streptomyces chlorus]|uniref:SixA phosphatase family protein n=1 Tax=Streptomyces chlorus TaxID=887452 RepID=A0ABW1E016_9ACTN